MLSLLSGGYRIGRRGVVRLAADLFGLDVSLGMVSKLERRTASALEATTEEIASHVRGGNANVDETSWREGNRGSWLWTAVGRSATLFRIAKWRNAAEAKELLGAGYAHVATTDRFGAYGWIGRGQHCWAHLARDFQAMVDRGGAGRAVGERLLGHSERLFGWWGRSKEGGLKRTTFQGHARGLRREVAADLRAGTAAGGRTAGTCRNILSKEDRLWTFASVEGVEPTNDAAERAVRPGVIWRKTSGGTKSESGSRFAERLMSVAATCRQQGRDLLAYLTCAVEAFHRGRPPPSILPPAVTT